MTQWYPLVYSRTYETDFRILAIPKFIQEEKQSIIDHILGTTRQPERLIEKPRISSFTTENICAVGITCIGRELIANCAEELYSDKIRDKPAGRGEGRLIYGFFGYVTKLDDIKKLTFPTCAQMMDLKNFQDL
jgi:hypothetical protein